MTVRRMTQQERDLARGRDWYVLTCEPQKEFVCVRILTNHFGLDAFAVAEAKWRRRSRYTKSKRLVERPIAPRYVFLGVRQGEWPPFVSLANLRAITGVVAHPDGRPKLIPTGEVDRLLRLHEVKALHAPLEQRHMQTGKEFGVGDAVMVSDGPFEGRVTEVQAIKGDRAHILMELMGGRQHFVVRLDQLEKL